MDTWKLFDITHGEHVVCNPTSEAKLARLVELLRLPPSAKVADIACGKGELLIRLAEAYEISGVGIDLSPFFIEQARKRAEGRASASGLTFIEMDGADFKPDEPHSLDLASCIGASWIFGGHAQTLDALAGMVKPGGRVVVGEPFWRTDPPDEYLLAIGFAKEGFGSHASNAETGARSGLELVYTIVSSEDDWDMYEGLQWYAADVYARQHPDDPDLAEVLEQVNTAREAYLHWGRDVFGWAIYLFRLKG